MRRNSVQTSNLESDILKRVRSCDGISRVELARVLGLAPSTAGVYVERLIAERFLTETEKEPRDAGRPPKLLRMNPDGGEFIGVDFEARNIMAVAVDFSDKPLRNARREIKDGDSIAQIIGKIEDVIAEVLPAAANRFLAIGVGVPGLVDSSRGIAMSYKYIPNWQNVPLAARLGERFGVPVFLEQNVRSMALAELWFGQGRGCRDFLCIGIRSGIGVGLILGGKLHVGSRHSAGEIGRWPTAVALGPTAGWYPIVGQSGADGPELQEIASVRAIQQALETAITLGERSVLRSAARPITLLDITHAAQQRDALTLRVVETAAGALGSAVGQLALLLDPLKVTLAGPLTQLGETFLEPVRAAVGRVVQASGVDAPEIVNSTMGAFSGALGAAALALHEWKPRLADGPSARNRRARKFALAARAVGHRKQTNGRG